ncbi:Protein CBG13994 [Caenorhabditis briggsae]|uniref:Protein CBG13994 n=1 Tax=Caenorhabditis briggsae TaxID=6238 RepID=A8XJ61_CAEBR|nr:Protein CBG13994 [Caenorhabditis briggsae]CAP32686.2 Protein CBG13994 [Caenorhabditis briggsae]
MQSLFFLLKFSILLTVTKTDYRKKTVVKPARRSQNVRKPKLAPIPQIFPNPPEVDDVEMGNEEEEAAPDQKPVEFDDLRPAGNHDLNVQKSDAQASIQGNNPAQNFIQNLKSEEGVDLINGSLHQGTLFNGRIDYADLDNGEHPEFMVPNGIEPPMQHNKRHSELRQGNAKRPKIERQEEPEIANPPETNEVKMRKPEELEGLGPTVHNDLNIQNQNAEAIAHDNNEAQNFGQNTRNRVKIEDFVEEIQQAPEVIILDKEAEIRSLSINLEDSFQEKALRAVRLFKANDQLIPIQDFNQLFSIVLKNVKSGRLQNPTGTSIKLCLLFKHLARSLIRPLGEFLMADTLKVLEEEIEKLEGSEEKIPLKQFKANSTD